MITSFRHDNKIRRKKRQMLWYFLAFFVILFLLRFFLFDVLGALSHSIGIRIWGVQSVFSQWISGARMLIASKESLARENQRLHDTIDMMTLESYSRDALRAENEDFKKKFNRYPERELLLARVLTSPARSPYDTLIIDAGSEHGIVKGMAVMSDGDFTIGTVTSVFKRSAAVTLYSSPGSTLDVTVGTSSIPVILYGDGGGNFHFTLPRGIDLSVNDLVDIPALAPSYAGVIEAISRPEGSSFQFVHVKMPLNIYQIKWVYVVAPLLNANARK